MSDGLVVVDKPQGWTSHQVVSRCRRILGTRKVGHGGTLDPMATGVLLVGFNRATRLLGHLAGHDKAYTATIRLGQTTLTDDAEGEILSTPGAGGVDLGAVAEQLTWLRGEILQVPSAVSAIKINGERAYAKVRRGEAVDLPGRPVTVSRFDVLGAEHLAVDHTELLDLQVAVECSSGTYVRALARDLGAALGCGGHLTALRRHRVSGFTEAMIGLDADGLAQGTLVRWLGLAEVARLAFDCLEVDEATASAIGYGRPLDLGLPGDLTAMLRGDRLLALYRRNGSSAVPMVVIPS